MENRNCVYLSKRWNVGIWTLFSPFSM